VSRTRDEVSAARSRRHLEGQLAKAPTPKDELWQACSGLVAAALHADRIREATNEVLAMTAELRREAGAA
jgi:hypothetical protein